MKILNLNSYDQLETQITNHSKTREGLVKIIFANKLFKSFGI
jgi:hypothetical protein